MKMIWPQNNFDSDHINDRLKRVYFNALFVYIGVACPIINAVLGLQKLAFYKIYISHISIAL